LVLVLTVSFVRSAMKPSTALGTPKQAHHHEGQDDHADIH